MPKYEVWVFGSRAKNQAKRYSDLDLVIVTKIQLDWMLLENMKEDFSQSDLPWQVDVIDWSTIHGSFRKIIEQSKIVVQPRKGFFNRFNIFKAF